MTPVISLALLLALAAPAATPDREATAAANEARAAEAPAADAAQVPAPPATRDFKPVATPTWLERRVDVGGAFLDDETSSSRLHEYRSLHEGALVPFFRFRGEKSVKFDLFGQNVGQDDMRLRGRLEDERFRIDASVLRVPHMFGQGGRVLVGETFAGSAANQAAIERQYGISRAGVNFTFLNGLLSPAIAGAPVADTSLQRDIGRLEVELLRDKPVSLRLTYVHEERDGTRGSGTAFGFGNVVETPEPIDYRTQDLALQAQYDRSWGSLKAGVRYNAFTNNQPVQTFANPFRATDATDASAYQSPGTASIGGAAFARIALPPDNQSLTGNVGVRFKLNDRNRVTADLSYGQWTQDEPFLAYTTNTAITTPVRGTDVSTLPARSLDGKIDVMSFNAAFNSRPVDGLNLNLRVRRYDLDNKTPRVEFEHGYVRYDAVWEDIPRVTVPYGYTNDKASASLTYDFGKVSLEGGARLDVWDRTFRDTEETTQKTGFASLVTRPHDRVSLRATVEVGRRTFEHYDTAESEHASFLEHGLPLANQESLRRYDQAERDTTRLVSQLEVNPVDQVNVALSYVRGKDDYDAELGLQELQSDTYTAEVDFTPDPRFSLFGWFTREDMSSLQAGRQSGATISADPRDGWTSAVDDEATSFGMGTAIGVVPDKLKLTVNGSYQEVNGNNDLFTGPDGLPGAARAAFGRQATDITNFDDTKMLAANAELAWTVQKGLTVAVGGFLEDYELRDDATRDPVTGALPFYTTGGFFMAGNDGDYKATYFYGRLSYAW